MKIMFDTNAFDKMLLSDMDKIIACQKHSYYITSIQIEEIGNIPDDKKEQRINNLIALCMLRAKLLYTPAVVGVARVGMCVVSDERDAFYDLLIDNGSNVNDAVIGSTAKRENCVVVTDDKRFTNKLRTNGIDVITFAEFVKSLDE